MSEHHKTYQWQLARKAALDRDGWRCRQCSKAGRLEVHHLLQVRYGGGDELNNLITYCRGCHIAQHARKKTPSETAWDYMIKELLEMER